MALPRRITNKRSIDAATVLKSVINRVAESSETGSEYEICEAIVGTALVLTSFVYQKNLANKCRTREARQDAERGFMHSAINRAAQRCWR